MPRSLRAADIVCRAVTGRDPLLDGVSLSVAPGEALYVTGRSGSGKSTLLEICAGLRQAEAGQVWWDEQLLGAMSRRELFDARRGLGYMFQVHALISNLVLLDNVALPLRHHGVSESEAWRRAAECMAQLGLTDVLSALPEDVPCGMQRKAALARAIVTCPDLLILDEPLAGLDPQTSQEMVDVIVACWRRYRPALVVAGDAETLRSAVPGRRVMLAAGQLADHWQ